MLHIENVVLRRITAHDWWFLGYHVIRLGYVRIAAVRLIDNGLSFNGD